MSLTRLGIVPGHAIFTGGNPFLERNWMLEDYQRDGGHHLSCFIAHLHEGLAWLDSNPDGRLVLSGGQSRQGCTRSEARSYLEVARVLGFIRNSDVADRISLEEYARDSFENIVNSLAQFYEEEEQVPTEAVCFGFRFKSARIRGHFEALQLPGVSFEYVGLNDPQPPELSAAVRSESGTLEAFATNPFSPQLEHKRQIRNPYHRIPKFAKTRRDWPALSRILDRLHAASPSV